MKPSLCRGLLLMAIAWETGAAELAGSDHGWQYKLSTYAWFAGAKGEVTSIDGLPAVPFKLSSKEAFEDNEASYTLILEATKGRHGVLLDYLYSDTRSTEQLVPAIGLEVEAISKNTLLSTLYVYQLVGDTRTVVDAMAGIRYWQVDSTLKFGGGLGFLAGKRIKNSEDWLDPMMGFKVRHAFNDTGFFAQGWLGLGGMGIGSDSFYDAAINLGYRWNPSISTTVGYRQYDVDYDDNGFVYDTKNDGWLLGLTWAF